MKKFLTTLILITGISFVVNGQTTVSGGIYANTTWTLANSPYTADTVVVFPNVTLTIEPGVVVIVNGNLEIRQAALIAEGTVADSITFIGSLRILGDTLSDITVYFHDALSSRLNYCIVKDNPDRGMFARMGSSSDTLTVKNSCFMNNGTGLFCILGKVNIDSCLFTNDSIAIDQTYCTITNSIFRNNKNGLLIVQNSNIQNCIFDSIADIGIECWGYNEIANCQINNNGIGIKCYSGGAYNSQIHNNIIEYDSIGIQLSNSNGPDSIYCNKICNNSTYNVKATTPVNRNVSGNYWCTTDSLTIANSVYDGYDNASIGLVNFMPIDTIQCYSLTGIPFNELPSFLVRIYPNPASDFITIESPENILNAEVKIFNLPGDAVYSSTVLKSKSNIDISTLVKGAYLVQVSKGERISRQILIKL